MTVMQHAFAQAERQNAASSQAVKISNKQRIWNIVKANPKCTSKFILHSLKDVCGSDVAKREIRELVDRDMLDIAGTQYNDGKRPFNLYEAVGDSYKLEPKPTRDKRPEDTATPQLSTYSPMLTQSMGTHRLSLPEGSIPSLSMGEHTLLDRVKAAPFGEVREIYTYLKEVFRD